MFVRHMRVRPWSRAVLLSTRVKVFKYFLSAQIRILNTLENKYLYLYLNIFKKYLLQDWSRVKWFFGLSTFLGVIYISVPGPSGFFYVMFR